MNKKLLWELFKSTGKIEYYIKYKLEDDVNDRSKGRKNL